MSPPRGLPEPSGKHVPPSWFCTTSTVCHAREVRACCIPLPTLRFAAFRAFPAPPPAEAGDSATSAVPATRFTPLEESPRRQPHRVTAAVALLWFHRRTASFTPPKRRDADAGPRPTRWAQILARSLARRPPHIHRRDAVQPKLRDTSVRVVERSPRPARRLRCRSRPSGREGGHFKAFLHRRVRELASPLPAGRSPHSFHGLCPPSRSFHLRAAAPPAFASRGRIPLRVRPTPPKRCRAPSESVRSRSGRRAWEHLERPEDLSGARQSASPTFMGFVTSKNARERSSRLSLES
jgi:hypothetical protein